MLKEKLDNNLKDAMRNKDTAVVSTIRFLKAAMLNASIDKRAELTDEDVIGIIKKQIKQRNDSIEEFKKGNRQDLVDKETREAEILKSYLPPEPSQQELLGIIKEAIVETGASSVKDMGKVMKAVMAKVGARANGRALSELVNKELSLRDGRGEAN
jgi:uncharacterized protein YqeY